MALRIGIVDYGLGNLASVAGAVRKLGHEPTISAEPATLAATDKLILPGVGAFGDGMENLRRRGLVDLLNRLVHSERKPILGICLGAQLMASESEEFGAHKGLGWIPTPVRRLGRNSPDLAVPHVGWNDFTLKRRSILFEGVPEDALFYYVHSYAAVPEPGAAWLVGDCDYGGRFVAAFELANIYGTQFHPEKSQRHGLAVLGNFLDRAQGDAA